jgi:hypothetical protein
MVLTREINLPVYDRPVTDPFQSPARSTCETEPRLSRSGGYQAHAPLQAKAALRIQILIPRRMHAQPPLSTEPRMKRAVLSRPGSTLHRA